MGPVRRRREWRSAEEAAVFNEAQVLAVRGGRAQRENVSRGVLSPAKPPKHGCGMGEVSHVRGLRRTAVPKLFESGRGR